MLEINPGLTIWTIIVFTLLLIFLRAYAWKPLIVALEKREELIRNSIEKANIAAQEAEMLATQHRKLIADAELKSQKILLEGRELGEKIKTEIIDKANQHSRHLLEQTRLEIEREREAALIKLRNEVANLALLAASKIIGENLDTEKHKKVIDTFLDKFPKN